MLIVMSRYSRLILKGLSPEHLQAIASRLRHITKHELLKCPGFGPATVNRWWNATQLGLRDNRKVVGPIIEGTIRPEIIVDSGDIWSSVDVDNPSNNPKAYVRGLPPTRQLRLSDAVPREADMEAFVLHMLDDPEGVFEPKQDMCDLRNAMGTIRICLAKDHPVLTDYIIFIRDQINEFLPAEDEG